MNTLNPKLLAAGLMACSLVAQDRPKHLHVGLAVTGDSLSVDSERTKAFASFLADRFGRVTVADVDEEPEKLASCSVVLLDWAQGDGVSKWFGADVAQPTHPLGPRDEWEIPLVFLGSAGLSSSVPWEIRGGIG